MQKVLHRLASLSRPAAICLQLGLSGAVLILCFVCCLLWRAGAPCAANLPAYLLARQLEAAARTILFVTVFATCLLEERCHT